MATHTKVLSLFRADLKAGGLELKGNNSNKELKEKWEGLPDWLQDKYIAQAASTGGSGRKQPAATRRPLLPGQTRLEEWLASSQESQDKGVGVGDCWWEKGTGLGVGATALLEDGRGWVRDGRRWWVNSEGGRWENL